MPQAFFDIHGHGKIISKIQYEVGMMSAASGNTLLAITRDGSTVLSFLIVMFHANWALSSVIFLILPAIYLVMKGVTKSIQMLTRNNMSSSEVQIRLLNEMVKGHQVVNLYNAQDFEHARYFQTVDTLRKAGQRSVIITNLGHTIIQFVASLILAILIYLSAYATELHLPPITPGDFVVIFTAMFGLLKPVRNLTNIFTSFIGSLTAGKSLMGILALRTEEDKGTKTAKEVNMRGNIKYEDVSFAYPSRPKEKVLNKFNLEIEAGKTYAFVGKSGSGKSTIASLLPRIYDVTGGAIKIDGVDIRDIKLFDLRDNISVVSQNIHLFDDTIYNNIIYCDEGKYSEEEVMRAAELAHVMDFAADLPDGIHTLIGSDGTRLSGGQRQRVSIARALLRQKPILILDEATSALDNESEYFIQQSLAKLQENKTVLVIAHRLSTIENADQILVISHGKILERGTHQELVADTSSEYYKLYTRDFEEAVDEKVSHLMDGYDHYNADVVGKQASTTKASTAKARTTKTTPTNTKSSETNTSKVLESKVEAKAEAKTEAKTETKTETKTESLTKAEDQVASELVSVEKQLVVAEIQQEVQLESVTASATKVTTTVEADVATKAESEADVETQAEAETKAEESDALGVDLDLAPEVQASVNPTALKALQQLKASAKSEAEQASISTKAETPVKGVSFIKSVRSVKTTATSTTASTSTATTVETGTVETAITDTHASSATVSTEVKPGQTPPTPKPLPKYVEIPARPKKYSR